MQNVIQTGKRALSVAVAATTMLFSVGAGLLQPSVAAAATAGDLIKGTSLSTVYYYGYDGMRYTFPNEKTYMTWYTDFSGVSTISDSALADLSLAGNVVYRPGSSWIKVQSDDKVYAVSTDGSIHWIESETVASAFAGSSWASRVQDVPDVFFTDYTVGSSLMTATAFDGMMYMSGGNYYVVVGTEKRLVSSAGRSANGMQTSAFLSGSGIIDSSLTAGVDITSAVSSLVDAAQTVTDTSSVTGGLSISLASSTAGATTVPDAASGVNVATFAVRADAAASISVMRVSLLGLSVTSNITSVYLYEGSTRLTDGKSFNSSTRQATFGSLGLSFAANETRNISVVVDMADAGINTTFAVGLASTADVEASGTISGTFPVSGATMSIVNSAVGGVTIIDTGSLTNPVLGAQDATISKFKLTASSTEDISLKHITLKIDDESDHSGFKLLQGSTWLADGVSIGNKLVMFDLGSVPYTIAKGADRTFTVTADIGGKAADAISVYLDNSADLYAVGASYGFGVAVTRTGFDATATFCDGGADDQCSYTAVQGGDLTASFSGPSAADVSSSAVGFSLFAGTIVAERAMTITAMPMNLLEVETSGGNDSCIGDNPLSNIRIVNADTGSLLMGPLDLTTDAEVCTLTAVLAFTDDFDMTAGQILNFKVTADMESTADAMDTFALTMDLTSGMTAEDENGDAISSIIPTSNLAGNAQSVVASGLTVSLASTPTGTKTYVRGTSDVTMASFNFAAASGGAIEMTDFSPTLAIASDDIITWLAGREVVTSGTSVSDRISSCSLYEGTTLISGPESIASAETGKVNFSNFSYSIPAGTTKTLSVHCNLMNVDPATDDGLAATVVAATDVTALDTEGDSATVTGTNINFAAALPTAIVKVTNAGSLAVTAASDTASADFLLTGSSLNTVSKFRFDATSEAFIVDRLTIQEQQGTIDATSGTDVTTYANNVSLVTISYPDSTGATQTASGALTGNLVTLNGLTFYVGKDSNASVTVKIDVPSTDRSSGSATSNERVKMVLDDSTASEARAVGQGSGSTLSAINAITGISLGDAAGLAMAKFVIRETKPTIALNSSSPTGAKVVGNQEALRFNVSASSGEDVILSNIIFTMSGSDNAASDWNQCDGGTAAADFHLYNLNKLGTATALDAASTEWTLLSSTGVTCTTEDVAFVKLTLATAEVIPAGTTYTYSMYYDSTGASAVNDDSVQFGIAADPIVSTGIALGTARNTVPNASLTSNTLTGAGALNTTASSAIAVGDIVYETGKTERMLVTAYTTGESTATVLRGYLGTAPQTMAGTADIKRIPSSLLWQDDGSSTVASAALSVQEYYGAYLVKSLPMTGNALSF